ncbi:MAG: hypothetical protein CL398_08500 [Acidiferrobacteraceae bacterium]|nr:hypothetical protein [Acidiferrobacteraceae bacterium]
MSETSNDATACRSVAMRFLERREYSRVELYTKLLKRGFETQVIDNLLGKLEDQELLSDWRFAKTLIVTRAESGYGPQRIRRELSDRGVSQEIVGEAMADADIDWNVCVLTQAKKKFGEQSARDFPEWARRARYLEYRGFDRASIQLAIGEAEDHSNL